MDQNMSYYPFTRKTVKWTTKFAYYMVCIAQYNSYVLWRERASDPSRRTYLQHLEAVAERWTSLRSHPEGAAATEEPIAIPPTPHAPFSYEGYRTLKDDPESRLNAGVQGHFLQELPRVGKKEKPTRPCRVCQKSAVAKAPQADAASSSTGGAEGGEHDGGGGELQTGDERLLQSVPRPTPHNAKALF